MFEVRNESEQAAILLYDYIGEDTDFWTGEKRGISAQSFKEALDEVSPKPVTLRIDSSGGDVFDAFAMCSAIQRYHGKVTACIDGLAASAASYIAVVCDKVVMNDYAYLMIHCASSFAFGNAQELGDVAARLDNIDKNLAAIYEKRSNLTLEQVLDYMRNETWFTAAEALDCGLATEVVETEERMAACIEPKIAARYTHVPEAVALKVEDKAGKAPAMRVDTAVAVIGTGEGESHAESNMQAEAVNEAAYVLLDGRIYRKGAEE